MQLRRLFKFIPSRSMSSFSQILNPITGQNTWQERSDDYDYHQEVANAGFGDMLWDWERNQKYFSALRKTIKRMQAEGREVHVLDIGTGTGLLSMMALKAGADTVAACEAFLPMAHCAERILAANGAEKVQLIKKRSTDIRIGVDMPRKANLLVAELLDTELIGEGAIGIYNHAHEELLTDDVVCIPARARCYAQVAQSSLAKQWNSLKILANLDGETLLKPPPELDACPGEATALHDVQLSQLGVESFRLLNSPVEIFQFDFQSKTPREKQRMKVVPMKTNQPGSVEMIFYWWDIDLDDEGSVLLSCAPYWAHPEFKDLLNPPQKDKPVANSVPWRDHWMQAIYYIPKPIQITSSGQHFHLSCHHDEYSLWFDAHQEPPEKPTRRHSCSCDLHMTYSRSRIGQLNQSLRNKRYLNYLEEISAPKHHLLVLGNGCLLGLASSALGAGSVQVLEPQRYSHRLLESLVKFNELKNVQILDTLDQLEKQQIGKLTHIFAEPYFLNAILPWDNFYFGTLLMQLKEIRLKETVQISPRAAKIFALPVEFLDLHKIRAPVGSCEGFDLRLFDQMVESSAEQALSLVEAQPLWEYPCRALSQPQEILHVDFANFSVEQHQQGCIQLTSQEALCNGIALWVDWQIYPSDHSRSFVTTGPSETIQPGEFVKWDMFVRQGVHFPKHKDRATYTQVEWKIDFKPVVGELKFNFDLTK